MKNVIIMTLKRLPLFCALCLLLTAMTWPPSPSGLSLLRANLSSDGRPTSDLSAEASAKNDFPAVSSNRRLHLAKNSRPTSDFRFPTSDFRFPTSDFPFPTSDFRFPTSDFPHPDWRQDLLAAVNAARARGCRCGSRRMPAVPAVSWNAKLEAAARRHVRDMARNSHFDHTGTDGSSTGQRATAAGYQWRAIAENIAWGYEDAEAVVEGWLKSTGHCRNIMDEEYKEMGAAWEGVYWAQVLGRE